MSLMRAMGILLGDADLSELESIFKDNPSLSIGLLRLVNSVGIGSGSLQPVKSLRQAIVVLGQKQLLRWVQLLLYVTPDGGAGSGLLQQVANRARLMELLAKQIDSYLTNFSDQAFMVGMLSMADSVMQMPLEEVLKGIGLTEDVKSAIFSYEGRLGQLLLLSEVIERGDFAAARDQISSLGIMPNQLIAIQLEAMQWTTELTKQQA